LATQGPGPAIIKSLTYYVDKKVVGVVDKLLDFGDFADLQNIQSFDFEEGDTLAVGERQWLFSYKLNNPTNPP
jgi:hypothetical protein